MDEQLLNRIYSEVKNGQKVAFATITNTIGSTPGKMGATIAVFKDGSTVGTVGGGMIEHKVIEKCHKCIENGYDCNFEYTLNDNGNIGMQCGGTASGYIKIFKPKPRLLIIGGGHIGLALFNISKNLDFYTVIIDDREEFANYERFNGANEVYSGDIGELIDKINIDENTYVIIATRSFEGDLISLKKTIDKNPNYIGMIGSKKKWINIKDTLLKKNICEEKLNNVYAPVGINISSNDVNEIAFGIMAELMLVKNNGSLTHRKSK